MLVASILLTLGLGLGGYYGAMIAAGTGLLANTIGVIMLVAGGLCAPGVISSTLRNV